MNQYIVGIKPGQPGAIAGRKGRGMSDCGIRKEVDK